MCTIQSPWANARLRCHAFCYHTSVFNSLSVVQLAQNDLGPALFFLQKQTFGLSNFYLTKTHTLTFCHGALIFYDHLQAFKHGKTKFLK